MAQLVKLRDYISRYEWDLYHYSSQFFRLKNENWEKFQHEWQARMEHALPAEGEETEQLTNFERLKTLFNRTQKPKDKKIEEDIYLPTTEYELKHYFLDELYPVQLKWATSTVTEISFMDKSFEKDKTLKYFLQRFPDIYLLLYYPIFNIKKAPVDLDIILISPVSIDIICFLEESEGTRIMASDERTWAIEKGHKTSRVISPMISLKRTEGIIKSILKANNLTFKLNKVVLSRTNNIIFHTEPYSTKIIGKQQYDTWFETKRNLVSPLKSEQLKVAEAILKYGLTSAVRRPDWEEDYDIFDDLKSKEKEN